MKRILLLLCIVTLACTLSFVVFAADDNTATSEYIITIPETLELDAAGTGNFTITLSDSLANGKVTITITGTSYYDGYWHLTNTKDANLALKYTLSSHELLYANNDALIATSNVNVFKYDYNVQVLDQPTTAGNYTDVLTFIIDAEMPKVHVDGLGDVEVNNPNVDLNYNPDDGSVGGAVPPAAEEPEEMPELPETVIPELIKFNLGRFQQNSKYTPGTYETVPYDVTYTKIKNPVSYQNIVWSKWYVTTDENDNIIDVVPSEIELADIDTKYTEYIIYNFETTEYLTMEGVAGDSVELWAPFMEQEDTLDNVIYLAAYLNKNDGCTTRHIAKWDGTKYVAVDYDANIAAVKEFTTTYTVTNYRQVEITAPSTSTEWVLVPLGEMTAAKDMTWAQWLDSEYNTTGQTNLIIKTTDFVDVALTDVIVDGQEYGFLVYELSGKWCMNEELNIHDYYKDDTHLNGAFIENIKFTVNGRECTAFDGSWHGDADWRTTDLMFYGIDDVEPTVYMNGWQDETYRYIDFGSESKYVSKEFYEWFTANATKIDTVTINGVWMVNPNIEFDANTNISASAQITINDELVYFIRILNTGGIIAYSDAYIFGAQTLYMDGESLKERNQFWDFGESQEISRELYEWLTRNAAPAPSISGIWAFNIYTDISLPSQELVQEFQFQDNWGRTHTAVILNESGLYFDSINQGMPNYSPNIGWEFTDFSIWHIEGTQCVSLEFYDWLVANAYQVHTELSGKYQFNETVSQWAPYYTEGVEVDINFIVDEVQWNKLQLNYMLSSGMSMVYMDNANNSCTAYERDDASDTAEWKTSRMIDFGNTPQPVSLELAIWIAMNATKIS